MSVLLLDQLVSSPVPDARLLSPLPRMSSSPLDLSCVVDAWPPATVTQLYMFTGGEAGATKIGDGGNDMFDGGNELRLRVNGQWTPPLEYTQECDTKIGTPVGRGDAMYTTCKLPGTTALFAAAVTRWRSTF